MIQIIDHIKAIAKLLLWLTHVPSLLVSKMPLFKSCTSKTSFFFFFFKFYPCIRYKIYRAKPKTFVLIKRSIVSILICGLRAFFKIKLKAHNHGFVESLIIIKNKCRTEFETLGGPFHNLCCFFFWPWGHPCRNIKESYLLCSNLTRPSLLFSFT